MSDRLPRSKAELEALATFYASREVADEVSSGDVVSPEPMVTTSLRLPGDVVDSLKVEAADRGLRYTSLIREVLQAHVSEPELSSRALASRIDRLEQEYDRRLRRIEDAQRPRIAEVASERAATYEATSPTTDDEPIAPEADG